MRHTSQLAEKQPRFPEITLVRDYLILRHFKLTAMERQILRHIACGETDNNIARKLKLDLPTLKASLSSLFDKIAATDRVDAAVTAYNLRLV